MDSSSVLRQKSQNRIQVHNHMSMRNEHNKMTADTKPSIQESGPSLTSHNVENLDPESSEVIRKAPVRPGMSRLPVLAKSLRLQTPSDFSQSHCRWEEKPLTGKAKKKKPCTRPVPFHLSQSKGTRMTSEKQQLLTVTRSRTGTNLKTKNINANTLNHLTTLNTKGDSTKSKGETHRKDPENAFQVSGHCGTSYTFKTLATLSHPLSSISKATVCPNSAASCAPPALNADECLDNMNLLSLKEPSKTCSVNQNVQEVTTGNFSHGSSDKGEIFHPDHGPLLSILREPSATGLGPATPQQSKPYNCQPLRVTAMKSRQKAGATPGTVKSVHFSPDATALRSILHNEGVKAEGPRGATPRTSVCPTGRSTSVYKAQRVPVRKNPAETTGPVGSVKSVQFSPDPATLHSILQNEGVKAEGPLGATPRTSVCPSGRSTSIYKAQRVPVRKNPADTIDGPLAVALKHTPSQKWTPQRVPNSRHQPMSSTKWNLSTQKAPCIGTPELRSFRTNLQLHKEEVVQRLFEDQEEEEEGVREKEAGTDAEQLPVQASTTKSHCDKVNRTSEDDEEQEEMTARHQPFFQAPERESVIFFSTGKKLFRAPQCEKQASSASGSVLQISSSVQSLRRDPVVQKSCGLSPVVAMLRRRFPPLEELRMDEEVATYTAVSVSATLGFFPPQPRCGNPLASLLLFEESSTFVPIDSSDLCPPLQDR